MNEAHPIIFCLFVVMVTNFNMATETPPDLKAVRDDQSSVARRDGENSVPVDVSRSDVSVGHEETTHRLQSDSHAAAAGLRRRLRRAAATAAAGHSTVNDERTLERRLPPHLYDDDFLEQLYWPARRQHGDAATGHGGQDVEKESTFGTRQRLNGKTENDIEEHLPREELQSAEQRRASLGQFDSLGGGQIVPNKRSEFDSLGEGRIVPVKRFDDLGGGLILPTRRRRQFDSLGDSKIIPVKKDDVYDEQRFDDDVAGAAAELSPASSRHRTSSARGRGQRQPATRRRRLDDLDITGRLIDVDKQLTSAARGRQRWNDEEVDEIKRNFDSLGGGLVLPSKRGTPADASRK